MAAGMCFVDGVVVALMNIVSIDAGGLDIVATQSAIEITDGVCAPASR